MKKILFLCIFLTGIFFSLKAQNISGKVLEKETMEPLTGVSIIVENSNVGTTTDLNGKYSIFAGEGDVLVFSYLGMETRKITVGQEKTIDVMLLNDNRALDEIVVVGYGVMKRRDLTGAISSVQGESIAKTTSSNALTGLAGKLPGVQVIQNSGTPGGDVTVRVRGIGTINNSDPLFVVDGIPLNSGIWYLNPDNIQSIDVLKDASATAIYGARGANGVIMVTTKNGIKGESKTSIDYSYGLQQISRTYKMLNASQYAALHNDMRSNAGVSLNPNFADPQSLGEGTDWLGALFDVAPAQKITALISGGDKTVYAISLGYYQQDGIIKNTGYNKVNLQSNLKSVFSPKFTVTSNVVLSGEKNKMHDAYTLITNAMRLLPSVPIYDENGNLTGPTGNAELNGNAINPVGIITTQKNTAETFRGLANLTGEYVITNNLQFKTTAGVEAGYNMTNTFYPKFKWGTYQQDKTIQSGSSAYEVLILWDNTLTFNRLFNNHHVTALVGSSFQDHRRHTLSAQGSDRSSDQTTELDNALEAEKVGGNQAEWAIMSYLGRVNYHYTDRYFLTASLRVDGSSRFGPNNRYAWFPSFSGAWVTSSESFMKDVDYISFLKLRAGYGQTGNQNISDYIFADKLEVEGQYNFGSSRGFASIPAGIIYPNKLANTNVKWESVEQYNIGFDISFLKNRISLSADFYLKNTNDMLTKVPVPQTSGYSLSSGDWPAINIGKVENKGMEFMLNTLNFNTKDFKWESGFNISFNRNKVKYLVGQEILSGISLIREGVPINSFYGYVVDHIYQNMNDVFTGPAMENRAPNPESHNSHVNTSPGDIAFKKFTEGDVITDKDRTIIGNPQPDFIAGLNNTFSCQNFELSFFIQAVYGNDVWNAVRINHEGMSSTYNQITSTLERWNGEGSNYTMPRAVYADPNVNNRASTRWVEDGSFIRFKNITLGYHLPSRWIKTIGIKDVKIYSSIDNLLILTNYSGIDPEVGVNGLDNVIYPTSRTVLFGVNVNF
jgi:TonB-linked SusC/RagA family outer membrane protein